MSSMHCRRRSIAFLTRVNGRFDKGSWVEAHRWNYENVSRPSSTEDRILAEAVMVMGIERYPQRLEKSDD